MTDPLPTVLTEARVREVFRIHAEQMSAIYSLRSLSSMAANMAKALVQSPEERMQATVQSLQSEPVQRMLSITTEKQRIEAIAKLIAMLGLDDARAHATQLSQRAAAEGQKLFKQAWRYTRREHALLHAAGVVRGDVVPIQPAEVDAVHAALDEILDQDRFLAMAYRNAESSGRSMREKPDDWSRPAGPRIRDAEARKWLSRKRPPSQLATNRFGSTQAALEFVEELYGAGAVKVVVPGESIEPDDGDGYAYSASLKVQLPAEVKARAKIFAIVNREALREGLDQESDSRQKALSLWWD